MRPGLAVIAVLLTVLGSPGKALGQEDLAEGSGPVSIEADHLTYEEQTKTYRARGDVVLRRGELTLHADRVNWNTATGEARAFGNVRVADPSGEMAGEALNLNLESDRGRLENGRIFVAEKNFHIAGEEIAKLGEQTYEVERGTFTTCDGPRPSWKFGARHLRVDRARYARARHVVFYLRDVPVFYLPYVIYPVKSERESGLLMPRYGHSEKRGTELNLAWYQVLGRNMDATFYLDYLSELGVGKGLEYRYIFGRDNEGEALAYHISGLADADDRYALDWRHHGTLPGRVRLSADVQHVSSRDYFEDFGEVAEEYNRDQVDSVIALGRSWRKVNLTGQFKYIKDLEDTSDRTLQRLPEIRLDVLRQRFGDSPFYYLFDGSATHFWREEGVKGQRLLARPALGATFHPGQLLEIAPEVGFTERLYWTSDEGPGFEKEGLFDFTTRLSTRFVRVYHPESERITGIQHSIEPEVSYRYVPPENQDHLPEFDAADRLGPENRLTYALINRFTARLESEDGPPAYHEFLYLRLSQDYDIRESRRDLIDPTDKLEPFSAVRGELILRPTRWSFLDLEGRYDVNSVEDGFTNRFLTFNARAGLRDGGGNALALDYRYRQENLEYLSGRLDLALFKPVYLNYQHRYDFEADRTLENVLNLEYRASCWSVFLSLRDRLEDREFLVTFALTGLGKVAKFGGSLGEEEGEE